MKRVLRPGLTIAVMAWIAVQAASGQSTDQPAPQPQAMTADEAVTETTAQAEPVFPVSEFVIRYLRDHPELPAPDTFLDVSVPLARDGQVYTAPPPGVSPTRIPLRDLSDGEVRPFAVSGLQSILEAIRDELVRRGYVGVFVAPDPFEIDEAGQDLRPAGETRLNLIVTIGIVTEVRTLASGERIDPDRRVNAEEHDRIRRQSPTQPFTLNTKKRTDLLERRRLDDYAHWLGRHPGRLADIAISPGDEPGSVTLDYLVTEIKPWNVFAQVSNTGTDETNRWRERFGFFHNQLTGNDDILSIDYSTAGFEDTHDVRVAYEAPVGESRRWRWRVDAGWNMFTASDVGFAGEDFEGESWDVGGELIWNFYQRGNLFLDAFVGLRYEDIEVDNEIVDTTGREQFLLPRAGLRLERAAEWYTNHAMVMIEFQNGSLTGVDGDEVNRLGRAEPDSSWAVLSWDLTHSFFLEPVLDEQAWQNPGPDSTLAHELFFNFRGQYGFDYRLIPQHEGVIGGLYTVRGYPESIAAGDTTLILTGEYRFHLPRAFKVRPEPGELLGKPFRYAPQYPYGTPDWDLIFRAFVDAGRVIVTDEVAGAGEDDETLVGAGIGIEFLYKRNIQLRLDWGFPLRDIEGYDDVGDGFTNRLHFVATLLY